MCMTLYIFYEKQKQNKNKQKNYTRYATLLTGTPAQHNTIPLESLPSIPIRKTSSRIRPSRSRSSVGRSRRCRLVRHRQSRNLHRLVGWRLVGRSRRSRLSNLSKGVIPRFLTEVRNQVTIPTTKVVVVGEHFEQLKSIKGDIGLRLE